LKVPNFASLRASLCHTSSFPFLSFLLSFRVFFLSLTASDFTLSSTLVHGLDCIAFFQYSWVFKPSYVCNLLPAPLPSFYVRSLPANSHGNPLILVSDQIRLPPPLSSLAPTPCCICWFAYFPLLAPWSSQISASRMMFSLSYHVRPVYRPCSLLTYGVAFTLSSPLPFSPVSRTCCMPSPLRLVSVFFSFHALNIPPFRSDPLLSRLRFFSVARRYYFMCDISVPCPAVSASYTPVRSGNPPHCFVMKILRPVHVPLPSRLLRLTATAWLFSSPISLFLRFSPYHVSHNITLSLRTR